MNEGIDIKFYDAEFNAAITELAKTSRRVDTDVLTGQAIQLVRSLVKYTRLTTNSRLGKKRHFKRAGRARAGWWPAWVGLGVFSIPRGTRAGVLSNAEGEFIDHRNKVNTPYVEMSNTVKYIETLDNEDNILTMAAGERFADMERTIKRRYQQMLRSKSGR